MSFSSGRPQNVLILATNPLGTEHLDLGREVREIKEALSRPEKAFEIEVVDAARIKDLENNLLTLRPRHIHFCGHGLGDLGIVFHDDSGIARTISTARLETLFRERRAGIHCVFLNCCFSRPQAEAIAQYVPFVVGTRYAINDQTAIEFSSLFYRALGNGIAIREAFNIAMSVPAGTADAQVPILLSRQEIRRQRKQTRTKEKEEDLPTEALPEAATLKSWMTEDPCRLIVLQEPVSLKSLSPGGGPGPRSSLHLRTAQTLGLDNEFTCINGVSLANRPPLTHTVSDLLSSMPRHLEIGLAVPAPIDALLRNMRSQRCLFCLEDVDAIVSRQDGEARYLEGFEDYGQLFHRVATSSHKSCLILSGREIPPGIPTEPHGPARVLNLSMTPASQSALFQAPGDETRRGRSRKKEIPSRLREESSSRTPDTFSEDLGYLVKILLEGPEILVFLGPKSASEGRKKGDQYPTLPELARAILKDARRDAEAETPAVLRQFRDLLRRWAEEEPLADRLAGYIAGEPGPAHYYLAALALTLFPQSRFLLFIATSFDDLLAEAFTVLRSGESRTKVHVVPIDRKIERKELGHLLNVVAARAARGEPVILKLFGELEAESPLLAIKAKIDDALRLEIADRMLWRPSIFIGCDLRDELLQRLLWETPGRGPAFIVDSELPPARVAQTKGLYHIPTSFESFVLALLAALRSHHEHRALLERIEGLLQRLAPHALYPDCESIARRAEIASRPSLDRVRSKLPSSKVSGSERTLIPTIRTDTQPDLGGFLRDPRPLLVIVGDSGTGKSTLFYQMHQSAGDVIPILYDIHEIEHRGSLSSRLAADFLCEEHRLEVLLSELDKVLRQGSRRILILLDGINECKVLKASAIKAEIESLSYRLPGSIKIAYSCRKVYWDNYVRNLAPLPRDRYFASREIILGRFSARETEQAFAAYQELFRFHGSYFALRDEFRQRITDPLMLRMLAEGYQEKPLPSFAPAVLIFDTYLKRLQGNLRNSGLPVFLDSLVTLKVREADSGTSSDQFVSAEMQIHPLLSPLFQQQEVNSVRPGNPLVLLEDEGVLTSLDSHGGVYRFVYDRFFEYLLGRALPIHRTGYRREEFFHYLRVYIQTLALKPFWFLQALKSEIIRLNIEKPEGPWSLYEPGILRALLADPDTAVSSFVRDVLRELTFEGEKDLVPVMESIYPDRSESLLLLLDIAPDSPGVLPGVVQGLNSQARETARRCCHILVSRLADGASRDLIEATLLQALQKGPLERETAAGLIYYTAALFGEADRRGLDPMPIVQSFWQRAWKIAGRDPSSLQALTDGFVKVLRQEGGHFFGDSSEEAMDYVWRGMPPEIKALGLRLAPLLADPGIEPDEELREIIYFFGSSIRDWSLRKIPESDLGGGYKLEYKMAEWILLQRCQDAYPRVKEILDEFVASGFWKSIDFCLSEMDQCCDLYLWNQQELLEDARQTMAAWTARFQEDEKNFYMPLDEEDPFSVDQCPIAMAASVDTLYFSPAEGPIPFLEQWISSDDLRDVQLALLCVRNLWRENPAKVLGTLACVARSAHEVICAWLDRILKEISLVYPRLVEDFVRQHDFDAQRIQRIKHQTVALDPSSVEHDGNPLYKALFLGPPERRKKVVEWYHHLHRSESLESFCLELIRGLLAEMVSAS